MPDPARPPEILYAHDREEWRAWLAAHHATAPGVWLAQAKRGSAAASVRYEEAVEEALCFGWIDSRTRSLDAERFIQYYSPRRPGGDWAPSNKERVARLIEQGRMTPAGLAKIEAARRDGSWNRLDAVEALEVPADLQAALAADETAARRFAAFSPSTRKMILFWIASARRPETRRRRIEETVRRAAENRAPFAVR